MRGGNHISVIIPALDEADAIGKVLAEVPDWVDDVIVADNGSTDDTIARAEASGARVTREPDGAYGAACLAGIDTLEPTDIVVFLDGDHSDHPQQMALLVDPIAAGQADFVIGSRRLGMVEAGALTPQQRFGNRLACFLIRSFWGVTYTDLGPFRAISRPALNRLQMRDRAFGWTVEMQLRAIQERLRVKEVPVDYRRRIGHSKISGTVKGTIKAGHAILGAILRTALRDKLDRRRKPS